MSKIGASLLSWTNQIPFQTEIYYSNLEILRIIGSIQEISSNIKCMRLTQFKYQKDLNSKYIKVQQDQILLREFNLQKNADSQVRMYLGTQDLNFQSKRNSCKEEKVMKVSRIQMSNKQHNMVSSNSKSQLQIMRIISNLF